MPEPMTPERLAEIRQRDAAGEFSLTTAADRRELLAEVERLTALPTHEERQHGLSDGHSESYRLGWRAGRKVAEAEVRLRAQVPDAWDEGIYVDGIEVEDWSPWR